MVLTIKDLKIEIEGLKILRNVSLNIKRGEILALSGPSGVGKTTLLFAIKGLLNDKYKIQGEIEAKESNIIFQDAINSLYPYETIYRQLKDIIRFKEGPKDIDKRINELLILVGLINEENILDKYPHQLSGGMAQKVCLALALIGNIDLLLLDEPTSSMDAIYRLEFLNVLKSISKNIGVLLVSHDKNLLNKFSDRILYLKEGKIYDSN